KRSIFVSNHQIYTDWIHSWVLAYMCDMDRGMHIVSKESLKKLPVTGWAMQFFRFNFLARNWKIDEKRIASDIAQITGSDNLGGEKWPLFFLIFPEGTVLCDNGFASTRRWAEKNNLAVPKRVLLPKSTGLYTYLCGLKGSVEYMCNVTFGYEGLPKDEYGEDYFSLRRSSFKGIQPTAVHFDLQKIPIKDIPLESQPVFDKWLTDLWYQKDKAMIRF
ncbi:hypothetical protein CANCADRAFT_12824, partial [Tortispora caseinolytica NRRL Y-17796]